MPAAVDIEDLVDRLRGVDDPREERGLRHSLVDLLFIALVAMVSGPDDAEPGKKRSMAKRRQRCGWDRGFMLSVLAESRYRASPRSIAPTRRSFGWSASPSGVPTRSRAAQASAAEPAAIL